jgi:hypothetical protein
MGEGNLVRSALMPAACCRADVITIIQLFASIFEGERAAQLHIFGWRNAAHFY